MRARTLSVTFVVIGLCLAQRPEVLGPLSEDLAGVYRAYFAERAKRKPTRINLANRVGPIELLHDDPCLEEFTARIPASLAGEHQVDAKWIEGFNIQLVDADAEIEVIMSNDPFSVRLQGASERAKSEASKVRAAASFMWLSSIAFGPGRRFAVLQDQVVCGSLCGGGRILVFQKAGGQWKRVDRYCSSWVA
jgi:hypothetical protein